MISVLKIVNLKFFFKLKIKVLWIRENAGKVSTWLQGLSAKVSVHNWRHQCEREQADTAWIRAWGGAQPFANNQAAESGVVARQFGC